MNWRKMGLLLFPFIPFLLFAQNARVIEDLQKPVSICMSGDRIFIVEESGIIRIFSMKTGSIVKSFGRKGNGPGEFPGTPVIKILKNEIICSSPGKYSIFSFEGQCKSERKIPFVAFKNILEPAGNNFLAKRFSQKFEKGKSIINESIHLYDKDFHSIKELYSTTLALEGRKFNVIFPLVSFFCDKNKIYIAEGDKGISIKMYDLKGNLQGHINHPYKKVRVDDGFKKNLLDMWKKQDENMFNSMKQYYIFPDYFPGMEDFFVDNGGIWVKTYNRKGDRSEFVELNIKGKELKRVFLPDTKSLYLFNGDMYFYLKDNYKDENWELIEVRIQKDNS